MTNILKEGQYKLIPKPTNDNLDLALRILEGETITIRLGKSTLRNGIRLWLTMYKFYDKLHFRWTTGENVTMKTIKVCSKEELAKRIELIKEMC